jgi:hypothetical protein
MPQCTTSDGGETMIINSQAYKRNHRRLRFGKDGIYQSRRLTEGFYYYLHPEEVGDRSQGWLMMAHDKLPEDPWEAQQCTQTEVLTTIPLKDRLEARLAGIGYRSDRYIRFERLLKILKDLRYVYVASADWSTLASHVNAKYFPRDVRIVSIVEKPNQIWSLGEGMIMAIEVSVVP